MTEQTKYKLHGIRRGNLGIHELYEQFKGTWDFLLHSTVDHF